MKPKRRFQSEKGSVLFIVLVFIIIISSMVLISRKNFNNEYNFILNEQAKLRGHINSLSGLNFSLNRLLTSKVKNAELVDVFNQSFKPNIFLDGQKTRLPSSNLRETALKINMQIQIQDSAGLINFYRAPKGLIRNFFSFKNIPQQKINIIIDSIMDWTDKDDLSRQYGAEKGSYNKYNPPNRRLLAKEELLLIRGININIYKQIAGSLDFSIYNRGLNPNTMLRDSYRLFDGLNKESIEHIIDIRKGKPFNNAKDLEMRTGYPFLKFANIFQFNVSNGYYINIYTNIGNDKQFCTEYKVNLLSNKISNNSSKVTNNKPNLIVKRRDAKLSIYEICTIESISNSISIRNIKKNEKRRRI